MKLWQLLAFVGLVGEVMLTWLYEVLSDSWVIFVVIVVVTDDASLVLKGASLRAFDVVDQHQ